MCKRRVLIATLVVSGCSTAVKDPTKRAAPHLQPVPSHLSAEAQAFLKRTRKDINENYVEKMGAIHRETAPDFRTTAVKVGGVKCFWVTSPKALREDVVVVYLHGGTFIYGSGEEGAGVGMDYDSTMDAGIILKDWDTWQDLATDDIWIPAYVGDNDLRNPMISPLYGDFMGFPPMLIHSATREFDWSGGIRLAQKAHGQGVDVTLDVWDGMWHIWHMMWPDIPESREACHGIAVFLKEHLEAF